MTTSADNRTLADRYADAVLEKRALEEKVKAMRAAILEMGVRELRGEYSTVVVTEGTQTRLDQAKVRKVLTAEQYDACLTTVPISYVRFTGGDGE